VYYEGFFLCCGCCVFARDGGVSTNRKFTETMYMKWVDDEECFVSQDCFFFYYFVFYYLFTLFLLNF